MNEKLTLLTSNNPTADQVVKFLRGHRIRLANEAVMQSDVETILRAQYGDCVEREARLDAGNRIDFRIGRLGIEIKANRAVPRDTRDQIARYADTGALDGILLITARAVRLGGISVPVAIYETGRAWL